MTGCSMSYKNILSPNPSHPNMTPPRTKLYNLEENKTVLSPKLYLSHIFSTSQSAICYFCVASPCEHPSFWERASREIPPHCFPAFRGVGENLGSPLGHCPVVSLRVTRFSSPQSFSLLDGSHVSSPWQPSVLRGDKGEEVMTFSHPDPPPKVSISLHLGGEPSSLVTFFAHS